MNETLVSSECVYIHAFNKLINRYGFSSVQKDYMDYIHDLTCEAVNEAWFGVKTEKQIHAEYELYYQISSYNHLTIINNSLKFIKKCRQQDIKQVIITNKPEFVAIPELKRLGFYANVDAIIGTDRCAKKSNKLLKIITAKLKIKEPLSSICNKNSLWIFGNSKQESELAKKYNAKLFLCQKVENINKDEDIIYTNDFNEIKFYDTTILENKNTQLS